MTCSAGCRSYCYLSVAYAMLGSPIPVLCPAAQGLLTGRRREEMGYNIPADHHSSNLGGVPSEAAIRQQQEQTRSAKDRILDKIMTAQKALGEAYQLGVEANAMAADLQLFKDLQQTQKELGPLMQGISKVRGL